MYIKACIINVTVGSQLFSLSHYPNVCLDRLQFTVTLHISCIDNRWIVIASLEMCGCTDPTQLKCVTVQRLTVAVLHSAIIVL